MALGKLSDRASDSALSPSVTKPSNGSSNGGKTFQFLKKLRMSTFGLLWWMKIGPTNTGHLLLFLLLLMVITISSKCITMNSADKWLFI